MSWLRKARKAVSRTVKKIGQGVERLTEGVNWKRVGMGAATLGASESLRAGEFGLEKLSDTLMPDVNIPPDAPLPAPSNPGQALDLSIGRKRKAASGRDSLKINRIGAVSKSVGVNVPR